MEVIYADCRASRIACDGQKKNSSPMTSAAKSIGRREAQLYKLLVTTQTTYIYTHTCTVYVYSRLQLLKVGKRIE